MMKKYISVLLIALLFCAVVSVGCGGGSDNDSIDPEQTESLNNDTGSYDPNDEARGNSEEPTDLSKITADYIAHDGEILSGTLGAIVKVSIADGATVTIRDVTINGVHKHNSYPWAGLNCLGDATINLEGRNFVKGFYYAYPGIHIKEGKTLTIRGDGELTARSNANAAGIGGGLVYSCGNIVIEGGTIKAEGGELSAGIGGGWFGKCGDITITGGNITATGGNSGAGIGSGWRGSCGTITINDTVTKVTATKGKYAPYSVGAGKEGSCGKVTVGGQEKGNISDDPFIYP